MKSVTRYTCVRFISWLLLPVLPISADTFFQQEKCQYGDGVSQTQDACVKLKVMTWNVNLLGDKFYDYVFLKALGQDMSHPVERAKEIGRQLSTMDMDIVVLEELIDEELRAVVNGRMNAAGYNNSSVLGINAWSQWHIFNGGVVIYSRFPVEDEGQQVLQSWGGQGWAAIGVKYVRLRLDGRSIHVFGAHLQTIENHVVEEHERLKQQMWQFLNYINSKYIAPQDIVLLLGDFNASSGNKALATNRLEDSPHEDFRYLLKVLNATEAGAYTPGSLRFSFNTVNNTMAQGKAPLGTPDNILCMRQFGCPDFGYLKVDRIKGAEFYYGELSDHHPVIGELYYQ